MELNCRQGLMELQSLSPRGYNTLNLRPGTLMDVRKLEPPRVFDDVSALVVSTKSFITRDLKNDSEAETKALNNDLIIQKVEIYRSYTLQ
jgi:hypothetical protein